MDIKIFPAKIAGTLNAISSKSYAHRVLICAALADKETTVHLNALSDDIHATIRCLEAMGSKIEIGADEGVLKVSPLEEQRPLEEKRPRSVLLDCGESGSTARFLLPLAAHFFDSFILTGAGKLPDRPFAPLCRALSEAGCVFSGDRLPISGKGKIRGGDFYIAGDISSQFVSGLLFALPLLGENSCISINPPLQSAAYADMTVEVIKRFGIRIEACESGLCVNGKQRYISPGEVFVEGDWSNAAFFLCMGALCGPVSLKGLSSDSTQGDKEIVELLRRFGADAGGCSASAGRLGGIDIDASQIPDLVPALSVVAAVAEGETRIINAQRLRLKESDRIESTYSMLSALGADISRTEDGLLIRGKEKLYGGTVSGAGDHRIVMAAATAACVCENPLIIKNAEAVSKSYPSFFDDFKSIGGIFNVV